MPAPTTTCSVCNQKVLKAQTYHIGEGKRACKSHEGTTEKAKAAQDQIKHDQEDKKRQEEERRRKWRETTFRPHESTDEDIRRELWAHFECWTCGKNGIQLHDWFARILIAHEKMNIRGVQLGFADLFGSSPAVLEAAGLTGLVPLRRVELPSNGNRNWILKECARKHWEKRQVVELLGFAQVCPECAKKFGLKFSPDLPIINFEDLTKFSAIYEVFMKPQVREMAEREVATERAVVAQN